MVKNAYQYHIASLVALETQYKQTYNPTNKTTKMTSQDETSENLELQSLSSANTPIKKLKRNKIATPLQQSPIKHRPNDEIIELFTIKTKQTSTTGENSITSDISNDVLSIRTKRTEKSYSERINERFKTVRQRARSSTQKVKFKNATSRIILEKLHRESNNVDTKLKAVRSRFGLRETKHDKADFFISMEPSAKPIEENNDVEFVLPEKLTLSLKSAEETLFLKPKKSPRKITTEDDQRRNYEDEGLYVPNKPDLPKNQLNLLKQRLYEDEEEWFDCNGDLNMIEDVTTDTSRRPLLKPLPANETTFYSPPSVKTQGLEEIVVIGENILEVKINELYFTHHPLFSVEHVYARKLQSLYETYSEIHNSNNIKILDDKIEALRHMRNKLENSIREKGDSVKEKTKINKYNEEIEQLQELLFKEGKNLREIFKTILETWKAIKKIREINNYSSTSIKLAIHIEKVNFDDESLIFERKIEEAINEKLKELKSRIEGQSSTQSDGDSRTDEQEERIRKTIRKRFNESFKAPGEPLIYFSLTQDHEITKDVEDAKEKQRRNAVSVTKIFLKIFCNKVEVCKSKTLTLTDNFVCTFKEVFSVQLVQLPKALTMEIYEQTSTLLRKKIGELSVKVPPQTANERANKEYFERNEIIHYKHTGVGSGVKLGEISQHYNINKSADKDLITSGCLSYSLTWDTTIKKSGFELHYNKQIDEIIDKNGVINKEKLAEWLEQNKPDPQDPQNSIFYEYSLNDKDINKDVNYFRLNPNMDQFQFCDRKEIDENLRLKLLQLRDQNEPEFDGMIIPNRLKEIPSNILADYNKRVSKENISDNEEDETDYANRGKRKLRQIQINIFQKCKNTENNLTFEDVVDEKKLVNLEIFIKSFVESFVNWFRWKPKIIQSISVLSEKTENSSTREIVVNPKIKVVVNSASNIPNRMDRSESAVFVEVICNNLSNRTLTARGPNPVWNEDILLPLETSHTDYLNPNSLNGSILLLIYDEGDNILAKFNSAKSKYLLGYLEIPLSAICQNTTMEGLFEMKTPSLLLGYDEITKTANTQKSTLQIPQNRAIYLNLKINVEPNIPKLGPSIEELPCSELPYIKDHIIAWNKNYNLRYPNRRFSAFAIGSNGAINCLVRYIRPLEPPQINVEGFDVTPEQCLRFISLIPFTYCNQFYQNICLTTQQFLRFMIGSTIDHAIALTCYLLALKLDVYLLLGYGIPQGYAAYVLEKQYDGNLPKFFVYDVVYGKKFDLNETFCTLQRIYAIVTENNIWANLQRGNDVKLVRFDLNRRSDWLPLFNNTITAPTNSIQNSVSYKTRIDVEHLEIKLERRVKKDFAKWRPFDRTVWDQKICTIFKDFIQSMELNVMFGKNISDAFSKLCNSIKEYKIQGHCLNLPFVNAKQITNMIKLLGVQIVDDCEDFALGVYVHSYPNEVVTVWVLIASLLKDK